YSSERRRVLRLSVALGGGLAFQNRVGHAAGILSMRAEVGGRTLAGAEASLWAVDGGGVQGALYATLAPRGLLAPKLELRAGFGVQLGDGVGPALDLALRFHVRPLVLYLRYDGALLLHDGTRDGQNTSTIGVETSF